MKGYLVLTEGRSGSNWLSSLANGTGYMGTSDEWIDSVNLGVELNSLTADTFLHRVLDLSSTDNGRFGIKLFPRHLIEAHRAFHIDLIRELRSQHDVSTMLLIRRDRHRQAVSFAKAWMTEQWRSDLPKKASAQYDFELICRSYFYVERSYAYWRSYLQLTDVPFDEFAYEDLVEDIDPYLSRLAEVLDVAKPDSPTTRLQVQRDSQTEEWVDRFRADLGARDIVEASALHTPPKRTLKNLWRFWNKQPMTPLPMGRLS